MEGFLSFTWIDAQFLYVSGFVAANFALWIVVFLFWRASIISRGKELDRTKYPLWLIAAIGSATVVMLLAQYLYRLMVN